MTGLAPRREILTLQVFRLQQITAIKARARTASHVTFADRFDVSYQLYRPENTILFNSGGKASSEMVIDRGQLGAEEYRELRATIRERGTARLFVIAITVVAWAAAIIAVQTLFVAPVLALIPLLILAAGFEVAYASHAGVERIGRYLEVFHESAGTAPPQWEHVAHRPRPVVVASGPLDALASPIFVAAGILNLLPVAMLATGDTKTGGITVELIVYGLMHLAWIFRVLSAGRYLSRQGAKDAEFFSGLHGSR